MAPGRRHYLRFSKLSSSTTKACIFMILFLSTRGYSTRARINVIHDEREERGNSDFYIEETKGRRLSASSDRIGEEISWMEEQENSVIFLARRKKIFETNFEWR